MTVNNLDPLDINNRLYRQLSELLKDMETDSGRLTTPQRIAGLTAIGRILYIFAGIKAKAAPNEPDNAGASVRKYARSFTTDGARRRAASARPRAVQSDLDPDLDPFTDDPDDSAA